MKKLLLFIFALFLWTGAWADKTVYLNTGGSGLWEKSDAKFIVNVFTDGQSNNTFYAPVARISVSGGYCYKFVVSDEFNKATFLRKSNSNLNWDGEWNRIETTFSDNDLLTVTAEGNNNFSKTSEYNPYSSSTKKTLYLETSFWDAGSGDEAYGAYIYDNTEQTYDWIAPSGNQSKNGKTYHKFEVPNTYSSVIFVRGALANAPINSFDERDNQTQNIDISTVTTNTTLYTITNWDDGGKDGRGSATSGYTTSMMNLSLLGTASASYSEGGNIAANANDGDNNTRWGTYGSTNDKNTDWLQIEWTEAQIFNTIRILCEGAMNRDILAFNIQTSNDGTTWENRSEVTGKRAANKEYITIQFDQIEAQYVRFQGVQAGYSDCYSFYEFEVYNYASPIVLTTLEITSAKTSVMASKTTTFTVKGKDQLGGITDPGTIVWSSTDETVGTISDGTFTANAEGTTDITATANSGAITSNSVTITVTALIEPTDVPTPTKDAEDVKAVYSHHYTEVGANIEGAWTRTNVEFNDKKALKVNDFAYIQFTLGATHKAQGMERIHLDVFPTENMPTIVIRANGDGFSKQKMKDLTNGTWDNDVDFSLTEDLGLTEEQISNITLIQIVKNNSGSGNGDGTEEFYIGNLYFWKTPAVDEENPVMTKAETSKVKHSTATLTVSATDNSGGTLTYIVKDGDTEVGRTTGIAGSDANVTVTGLTPETEYTLTVTATDHADNVSTGSDVNFTTTAAPDMYDDDVTIDDDHLISYHFELVQNEFSVTASFEKTNDVSAGPGQIRYRYNNGGDNWVNNAEYTWENCTPGYVIEVQYWWDATGRKYSKTYQYTVKTPTKDVIITSAGWASFSSNKDLNFDGVDNLTAYKATVNGENDVTLVEVTEVKAGEGVILKGTAGTYNVPLMANAPDALEGNLLKPGYHKVTSEEVGSIYAFGRYGDGVAFVKAAENYQVSAGRAYLDVSGTGAKNAEYLNFYIGQEEGETDGINKVNTLVETGVRYNLAGQRVGNDYKGIVIVNGRKVVIK